MKYLFLPLLFFCWACESKKTIPEKPVEWVHYAAAENNRAKRIVLVSGDEEYRSEEALPQLALILNQRHGFDCTVLFAQHPDQPGLINPNFRKNIPGLQLLDSADLVIWFTRFRELPPSQMQLLEDYLKKGLPLLGIRTSTHAFNMEDSEHPFVHYSWNYQGPKKNWQRGFGKKVLGETWFTHHGSHKHQSTRGIYPSEDISHELLKGIPNGSVWGPTDVYGVRALQSKNAEVVLLGQTIDRTALFDEADALFGMRETDTIVASQTKSYDGRVYNPNEEMPPLVWSQNFQLEGGELGRSVTSTIGSSTDLLDEEVRRLLVNSCFYLLGMEVPEKAQVDLIGEYTPSAYQFHEDQYWQKKQLLVSAFEIKRP